MSFRSQASSYGHPLRSVLLPFCEREGIEGLAQLDRRALDRLLENGGRRGALTEYSVKSYLKAVNQFLAWGVEEGEQVPAKAQMPRTPKRLIDVLSREEVQSMEDAAQSERDKLIVRLLADTGIRVGELTALRVDDLVERDHHQYLRIHGKGARERLVGIPRLRRRLDRYVRGTQELRGPGRRIFRTLRRRPDGQLAPLTVRGVQKAVEDAAERAGIHKRVHPHLFRHSYATWAINRGMVEE